ncbi:MAG: AAA family ATPase [Chitinophagales bacterium]|nr:ParA family protein [Bacteroidota bacterium]MCB9042497.1 ParA family protein [Chitinophagales bacterium]
MGKIIAIANQKGGVGKTTSAISIGAALGVLDQRVLLIDADPQANATSGLGIDPQTVENSIYECIIGDADLMESIRETGSPNLHILPSHVDLVGAEIELINQNNREYFLKEALEKIKANFDYIIIDCSPSLGIITINALTAADSVIVPVQCEFFALEGLGKLLNTIKLVQTRLNKNLAVEGILLTMYDPRLRLSNQVVEEVRHHFKNLVFKTLIHRNTRLGEAPSYGQSIIIYDIQSKGASNYIGLAKEIILKNRKKRTKTS